MYFHKLLKSLIFLLSRTNKALFLFYQYLFRKIFMMVDSFKGITSYMKASAKLSFRYLS